ncbi:MAG: cation:dicarboxylase symporter family transporter [Bacteroidetes bacterium]|nr:cation:dicarboxylase symporter family transporter [Bacteroidota bacterium]
MKLTNRQYSCLLLAATTLVLIINLGSGYGFWPLEESALLVSRWIVSGLFLIYAFRRKSLTSWILVSMLIGVEFGHDFPSIAIQLNIFSKIFLRMVKTIIAPLLFGTLVVGIAGHSDLRQVGRMGWKSIVYFEVVSTLALFIGLIAINLSKAGMGVVVPAALSQQLVEDVKPQTISDIILHIFPENLAKAVYEGQVLQIVIFSILFGMAVALLKEKHKTRMVHFAESLSEVMFKFTNLVMYFAPIAVFAAIAYSVGHMGLGILSNLLKLLATFYVALAAFLLLVLFPILLLLKFPVKNFFLAILEPATIAFATTSSESALPRAMEAMEKFGVPRKIVAFVIPTGYSFNLDGTTLYLSLATIFVAQVAGIPLTIERQLLIVFTLMLTSKGVAGVPRACLVVLIGTAASFGLPSWPIFIILGIDELMDMARSAVNVTGNCLATAVIARWEGEFDDEASRNFKPEKINE